MNLDVLIELIKGIIELTDVIDTLNGAVILKLTGKVYFSTLRTSTPKLPVLLNIVILEMEAGVL